MSRKVFEHTIKISSPEMVISLPEKWNGIKRLKVSMFSYTTASAGNQFMIINLTGFNDQNFYYDPTVTQYRKYTKWLPLLPISGGTQIYDNFGDRWDYESETTQDLSNFTISCLINGAYNADITTSNPVYITIIGSQV